MVAEIQELGQQLMYAPAETRRRQMDAAERLLEEVDPRRLYPADFVIYRVTGYRTDRGAEPVTIVGEALVADLITLIQRLSDSLDLPADDRGRRAIPFDELPQRLSVSVKSLQRYRRQGLVCHYVVFADGSRRLACFEDRLKRFVDGHGPKLRRAAAFSRLGSDEHGTVLEEARELRRAGLSLNAAARELALRHGRAHETMRMLLRRHDRRSGAPIFSDPGPLTPRDEAIIYRAARFGVRPALLAGRFRKSRASIHRAINRRRAEVLRRLDLAWVELPTMDLPDAQTVILSAPAAAGGAHVEGFGGDALLLIERCRGEHEPPVDQEHGLIAALNLLARRAARAIAGLGERPGSEALDVIETDLRRAAILRRRLVRLGLPAALRAVEQALGRPLWTQPAERIETLMRRAVEVTDRCVGSIDPGRGQRLWHLCGFAMSKAMAALGAAPPGRAARRHRPGSVRLPDLMNGLIPWSSLELRLDLVPLVPHLPPRGRALVEARYGLAGERPLSLAELARRTGSSAGAVAAALARAEAMLRGEARRA
jgi:hypothetical protein